MDGSKRMEGMSLGKLAEAKRLHEMGFGVHWLRPRSKVPVDAKWTTGERDEYKRLKGKYQSGYNIGTKLGRPSKTEGGYLAVLDLDVKSTDEKYRKLAETWVKENFKDLLETAPVTRSGRGNGSRHIWFLVKKPVESRALYSSPDIVEVMMPSAKPTTAMVEKLGKKKIAEGWRLRPAFEIDFMCEGRQVVLPPSIHPDTGKEYRWSRPFEDIEKVQVIDIEAMFGEIKTNKKVGRPKNGTVKNKFEITDPDEAQLEQDLPVQIISGIYDGDNVTDRSAFCLSVALAMVTAQYKDSDILGVLTNRDYFIGSVAFEHAKTSHRQRAARWIFEYCIQKARHEADATYIFNEEVEEYETLSGKKAKAQQKRITTSKKEVKEIDWKKLLDRTDKDKLKTTFKNIKLILQNEIGSDIFVRDAFANRDYYGRKTPWGGKVGEMLTDDDNIKIKDWFAFKYKIEPGTSVIFEAMIQICNENHYHPVKTYLESLEWDGVPRISTWIRDYLGGVGPDEYLRAVSRKFLIAAVSRIYEPGKKFDYMVILEGDQGKGKSTVGSILASAAWFSDGIPDLTDKDAALNLQGQWIVEMGELSQMRKQDVEVVKAFLTRQIDKVRPPYGKRMVESKRQCVFFGTTNQEAYLKDKTGNRRFWPVKITDIDLEALKRDRDQLWAEALFAYDNTEELLYLTGEAKEESEQVQDSKMVEDQHDVIFSKLSTWLQRVVKHRRKMKIDKPLRIQITELFEEFNDMENVASPLLDMKPDNFTIQMVGQNLSRLGFVKISIQGKKYWRLGGKSYLNSNRNRVLEGAR